MTQYLLATGALRGSIKAITFIARRIADRPRDRPRTPA